MPRVSCLYFFLAWLLIATSMPLLPSWADSPSRDDDSPDAPVEMSEVIVTGARVPVSSAALPAPATVLTPDFIEKTPFRAGYQVDDLLRYVPDVQPSNLSSRYNHPTAQAVSLRGL